VDEDYIENEEVLRKDVAKITRYIKDSNRGDG
jgi:hypothetical protein